MTDNPSVDKGSTFPCKNCGATLVFKPGETSLECPYCGSKNEIIVDPEKIEQAVKELDYKEFLSKLDTEEKLEEKITVKCTSCGATFSFDENVTSGSCAYCGTKIVAQKHSQKQIKPSSILPFNITKTQAGENFAKWIKKLRFAPDRLKKLTGLSNLNGVYMPYWTFDAETVSEYLGERGDYFDQQETYTATENNKKVTKTRKVRKIRWEKVRGTIKKLFNDILIIASKSLQNKYIPMLEPWDLDQLVPYDDQFLSGFQVESYSVDLKEGFHKAKQKMEGIIRQAIVKAIGGDQQKINAFKTDYRNLTFKHILLPLWISAYTFQGKTYQIIINARTGEVHGDRPYSKIKIFFTVATIAAIIALIIFLIIKFTG
ncbi:MAG: hypothetical protein ACP5FK_07080 [bacterium]